MRKSNENRSQCLAAIDQIDITPPTGIYHRMWGAAKHDRAAGVHRPLKAGMLWLQPIEAMESDQPAVPGQDAECLVLVVLDHCILDPCDVQLFQKRIASACGLSENHVVICLTHTHAAGLMSRTRSQCTGGEGITPYLDSLGDKLSALAKSMQQRLQPVTILYGEGRCSLAAERDYWDAEENQFVCGFNPPGQADDSVVVAKLFDESSCCIGTVVNYACHPTTLAWDNQLISPDYVGSMRELIEQSTNAPCLFLQGASGDLGPKHGFVGDTEVADQNGRQLGYAALSILESLQHPHDRFEYQGSVLSGTRIGVWGYQPIGNQDRPVSANQSRVSNSWRLRSWDVALPYRSDLLELSEIQRELDRWTEQEKSAIEQGDATEQQRCRAMVEQMNRQLWRQNSLPPGKVFPLQVQVLQIGQANWVMVPGEHYQVLQTTLRQRFPDESWIIATLCNGWQPGYIPPASKYGYGIYQEQIAVVGPGSAELVIEAISRHSRTSLREVI